MGFWNNPINKGWRRLPQPIRTGLGIAGGAALAGAALPFVGAALGGVAGAGATAGASSFLLGNLPTIGFLGMQYGQNQLNYRNQQEQARWERETYREQMAREDTAMQRRMADLKAAGLNPALAYSLGGAASSAGGHEYSPAQMQMPDGLAAMQFGLNRRAVEAQVANLEMDVALKQLEAQKRGAELPYFAADMEDKYVDLKTGRRYGSKLKVAEYNIKLSEDVLMEKRISQAELQMSIDRDRMALAKKEYRNSAEHHGLQMRRDLLEYAIDVRDTRIRNALGYMRNAPPGLLGSATDLALAIGGSIPLEPQLLSALKILNGAGLLTHEGNWNFRNLERIHRGGPDSKGNYAPRKNKGASRSF